MGETKAEFITESFEDLSNILGNYSKLTESEKKDSWINNYKGKYVRWNGVVNYKGLTNDDWNRIGIRHNVDTNVEMMLGKDKKGVVKMINKGDRVTYTGKLSFLFNRNLMFKLEDANVETVNDVTIDELANKLKEDVTTSSSPFNIPETSANPNPKESPEGEDILSFEGLNKIFGKNSSISQSRKEELWKSYRGKEIEWQGVVNYKGPGKNDLGRIGIRHNVGTNVELKIDADSENLINMIQREDKITYTGRLAKLFGRNLLCSVENIEIKTIGDKEVAEIEKDASVSDTNNITVPEVIKEPEIILEESMAPKVTKSKDVEIIEAMDGSIKIPFEDLDALFGKESRMTESLKDKLWKEYKNKYIRWTGVVVFRGKGRVSGLRMGIKHHKGTDVELVFSNDKERLVLGTKKGDKVTYTGKLVTRRGYILPYKLEDANIESILKESRIKE
ncbi:phosphomannomutase [Candidatus Scalindua japonica]|uniref:Phosphomannomutase n=2 Tax=Candidatus Scalindua japonica TaxID=1284222 RepID=A0A286U3J2_9BACT|nr:phosphomannomutase [Candidatus Scalindua japonica]